MFPLISTVFGGKFLTMFPHLLKEMIILHRFRTCLGSSLSVFMPHVLQSPLPCVSCVDADPLPTHLPRQSSSMGHKLGNSAWSEDMLRRVMVHSRIQGGGGETGERQRQERTGC